MEEYLVKSLDDIVGTKLYKETKLAARIFRGQANYDWDVLPGLYRSWNKNGPERNAKDRHTLEQHRIASFIARAEQYVKNWRGSFFRDLILAQHYGMPTRLLDWSTNPLVAAYFAVADYTDTRDGAIIIGDASNSFLPMHTNNKQGEHYPRFAILEPPTLDHRILAQQSVFTIATFDNDADYFECLSKKELPSHSFVKKLRIPGSAKPTLHGQLRQYGITPELLFPGIEGLGKSHGLMMQEQLG